MKIYCKKCKADRFVVTGNTTYCIKCNTPIYITKEFPIYTQAQMNQAKEQAYYAGFEDGVEQGFDIGYSIGADDKDINGFSDFISNRFTKVE